MGNCQAAEAAAVVIQHPGGKVERLHGPATAAEVMRGNPGHYVALVVLRVVSSGGGGGGGVKVTKVKLLKPKDALVLGQVYRLVTSQEVAKAIQARRQDKARRGEEEAAAAADDGNGRRRPQQQPERAAGREEQGRPTSTAGQEQGKRAEGKEKRPHRGGGGRGRHWRPSLQSISEAAS